MLKVIISLIFVIKLIIIPKKPIKISPKINSKFLKSLIKYVFKLDKYKKNLPKPATLTYVKKRIIKKNTKVIYNYQYVPKLIIFEYNIIHIEYIKEI